MTAHYHWFPLSFYIFCFMHLKSLSWQGVGKFQQAVKSSSWHGKCYRPLLEFRVPQFRDTGRRFERVGSYPLCLSSFLHHGLTLSHRHEHGDGLCTLGWCREEQTLGGCGQFKVQLKTHGFTHPPLFLFVNNICFYVTTLRYSENNTAVEWDIITLLCCRMLC